MSLSNTYPQTNRKKVILGIHLHKFAVKLGKLWTVDYASADQFRLFLKPHHQSSVSTSASGFSVNLSTN